MNFTNFKANIKKPVYYIPIIIGSILLTSAIIYSFNFSEQDAKNTLERSENSTTQDFSPTNETPADSLPVEENQTASTTNNTSKNTKSSSSTASGSAPTNSTSSGATTPAAPIPESLSAQTAFYSDSQSDTDGEDQNHQRVVGYIMSTQANPVFHAGDLMEDGTQASLDRFNLVTSTLRLNRTFYSAQGNNERDSSIYFNNFSYPNNERWFSVNTGNLHIIVLDNYASAVSVGSAQYNWLLSDLQSAASRDRLTGIVFHYPIYGIGGDYKSMISSMVPLFRTYGVDFVVSGHEHAYQHTVVDGINYFVCSGQPGIGYLLARAYTSYLTVSAYNADNALIESITINQR